MKKRFRWTNADRKMQALLQHPDTGSPAEVWSLIARSMRNMMAERGDHISEISMAIADKRWRFQQVCRLTGAEVPE